MKFDELDHPLRGIAMQLPALPTAALRPENTGCMK